MARRHSDRVYRHTVTLQRTPDVVSSQGGVNPSSPGSPITFKANVQFGPSQIMDDEMQGATITRTVQTAEIYLPADPGVKRGDAFGFGDQVLNVKGPANDTGYGNQFWVDCEVVT